MKNNDNFYDDIDAYVQLGRIQRSEAIRAAFRGLSAQVKGLFTNHKHAPGFGRTASGNC